MSQILLFIIWILVTLSIAAGATILGKKYGASYPIAIMASLVVVANVIAAKVVPIGPFAINAGVLIYASTFLITDILAEVWGKDEARKAIWAGFFANIALVLFIFIAVNLPTADFALEMGEAFNTVFGLTPRIVLGSMIAYLVSQHWDVFFFHKVREWTKGKHLWLRNNLSTITSQIIDSVLFVTIAFYGVIPITGLMIGYFLVKVVVAIVDTPFAYAAVKYLKR
jgi:hypothetical protein